VISKKQALREAIGTGRMEMEIQSHFLLQGMPSTPKSRRLNENIARAQLKLLGRGYSDIDVIRGNISPRDSREITAEIYEGI